MRPWSHVDMNRLIAKEAAKTKEQVVTAEELMLELQIAK